MFSPAWFAAGRSGRAAVPMAAMPQPQQMQQVQRSLTDFAQAAQAIKAAAATQAAAAAMAGARPSGAVPNGIAPGGLQPATGYNTPNAPAAWSNATLQPQATAAGRTQVTVKQTAPQASLTWSSFNVGAKTTLTFDQSAGGSAASTWVALNRVTDPGASPSQILGSIQAQGHVYVINRNGVIFGAGSQVNTGSLLVSAADLAQPLANGIYGASGFVAGGAEGAILVQPGAQITTNQPTNVTDAGGGVILLGASVENDGAITTPNGQALLASGQTFTLSQGYATNGNTFSTTRGTTVSATGAGQTTNTGIINATTGDITLYGETVTQAGVLSATSSVSTRGTIHLQTPQLQSMQTIDPMASVIIAPGAVTAITPDPNSGTALNSQRAAALATTSLTGGPGSGALGPATSRIEIDSDGLVDIRGNSLTLANAGQILVTAAPAGRIQVGAGAVLDVSGLVGVTLPASSDALPVNIQGFEQRDAPANRDTKLLNNANVYVDASQLVLVPASAAYSTDRYYTAGGLLEVSGALNTVGHSIQEWDTVGGTINLQGGALVAQPGSVFNIAGGSVTYAAGLVPTTYLRASNGGIYDINTAPADLTYTGVYTGVSESHPRWGVTETLDEPLISPGPVQRAGYTVGRDAGSLTIGAPTTIFAGEIDAGVVTGAAQTGARPASVADPFLLPQTTAPLPGSLVVQQVTSNANGTQQVTDLPTDLTIGAAVTAIPASAADPLPAASLNTTHFSAADLSGFGLGGIKLDVTEGLSESGVPTGPTGSVTISEPLTLATGGELAITALGDVSLGSVAARGGSVLVTPGKQPLTGFVASTQSVSLAAGSTLDLRGLWTNEALDGADTAGAAFIQGGTASLVSDDNLVLGAGSVIDVSAGAVLNPNRTLTGGAGGSVTLIADKGDTGSGELTLGAAIRGYGVLGAARSGGTLTLSSQGFVIGDGIAPRNPSQIVLPTSLFQLGFQNYTITGYGSLTAPDGTALPGVAVAPGTQVNALAPVYQYGPGTGGAPTGSDPAAALTLATPPLYTANPQTATVTQRAGASVSLIEDAPPTPTPGGGVLVASGASVAVDPGQSITLRATDQLTVLGSLVAPSGSVTLDNGSTMLVNGVETPVSGGPNDPPAQVGGYGGGHAGSVPGLSIWLGPASRVDVAARPFVAVDEAGRPFGVVPGGGSIQIGTNSSPAFIALRAGAVLDASGTSATLDLLAGGSVAMSQPLQVTTDRQVVASNGGSIALTASTGIYLDGTLRAAAGGPGASGGSLSLSLYTPVFALEYQLNPAPRAPSFPTVIPDYLRNPAEIVVDQVSSGAQLPASLRPGDDVLAGGASANLFARATLGVDQVTAGGFGSLALSTTDFIVFQGDVSLSLPRQLTLAALNYGDPSLAAKVALAAPYVSIAPMLPVIGDTDPASSRTGSFQVLAPPLDGPNSGLDLLAAPRFPVCVAGGGSCTSSTLTVSADLLDLSVNSFNIPQFGLSGTVGLGKQPGSSQYGSKPFDLPGFNDVTLVSTGDVRLIGGDLINAGNVSVVAGQVYVPTGETGAIEAGIEAMGDTPTINQKAVLSIGRNGAVPAPPLSAFGSLFLNAPTIEQGGIVRAPFGSIELGQAPFGNGPTITSSVVFLPGSVTSVSGAGLTVPYGGTADNVLYTYDGAAPSTNVPTIGVASATIAVQAGATLDLGGGGTLTGGGGELYRKDAKTGVVSLVSQGFITGRGGSTDTLVTPFLSFAGGKLTSSAGPVTSTSATQIYAIVPGYQGGYAPVTTLDLDPAYVGSLPATGERISVPAGIPGLAAGPYTLLPSYYALLPGAYRVQVETGSHTVLPSIETVHDGSYEADATLGVANTGIGDPRSVVATFTPGSAVRRYSDYNETSYASFESGPAIPFGGLRNYIPADAGVLSLNIQPSAMAGASTNSSASAAFTNSGDILLDPATGGIPGTVLVSAGASFGGTPTPIEITATGATPTPGYVSIPAATLTDIGAPTVGVGGYYGLPVNGVIRLNTAGNTSDIVIRNGATLAAGQIFLVSANSGAITVETGAMLTTLGGGRPAIDSTGGYAYDNESQGSQGSYGVLALSNGFLDFLPPSLLYTNVATSIAVDAGARLISGGTLAFSTVGSVTIDPMATLGGRYVNLSVQRIDLGDSSAAPAADVPAGLSLTPATVDALVAGNAALGVPALQTLTLAAAGSVNVYGTATLGSGGAMLQDLVLVTPAIYGYGAASDAATLAVAGTLTWTGATTSSNGGARPDAPVAGGPGSGHGTLTLSAATIVLGYTADSQPPGDVGVDRTILGFNAVNLNATQGITANNKGTLSVYQSAGAPNATGGVSYQPATLTLTTPVLTESAGASLAITAGGPILISSSAPGGSPPAPGLGGTLSLTGGAITVDGAIALPSGRLTLDASGNIALGPHAAIDLSGRSVSIFDQTETTGGGSLIAESGSGNITLDPAGRVDVSAATDTAGSVAFTAENGFVALQGTLLGSAPAGFASGGFSVRAGTLADGATSQQSAFSALNQSLTTNGFFGARSFEVGSGDLSVGTGDSVKASKLALSVDAGNLTVSGTVDASGASPGSIALSANGTIMVASGAILTAASSSLRTDSDGNPIDAANRGTITLTSVAGSIALQGGAVLDVSDADGVARGQVTLNVPRVGANAAAITVADGVRVNGAATIAVDAFRTYAATDSSGTITQTGTPPAGGIGLASIDADSTAFINAALKNQGFLGGIAELTGPYAGAFHLRPGVEIDGSAQSGGNLSVVGDVDLSGYRYESLTPGYGRQASVVGSGEPGVLVLRAANNLVVNGSISDGFGPVAGPGGPNANGWQLNATNQVGNNLVTDTVVESGLTRPVTLNGSLTGNVFNSRLGQQIITVFPEANIALNYAIQIRPSTLQASTVIPTQVTLGAASGSSSYVIPAGGFTTAAKITLPGGTVIPAGTVLSAGTVLPVGTVLAPGSVVPFQVNIVPPAGASTITWPAGASLAAIVGGAVLAAPVQLTAGDVVPAETAVGFPRGTTAQALRPTGANGTQGVLEPLAPLLQGVESWSFDLVAGANARSADRLSVLPTSALPAGAVGSAGSIVLSDAHETFVSGSTTIAAPAASVIRTGTGSLALAAAGSLVENSAFGIYTAGTQPAGTAPVAGTYTPTGGGDVSVLAQADIVPTQISIGNPNPYSSGAVGDWLSWRGGNGTPGSWSVQFGQIQLQSGQMIQQGALTAFAGVGTFGGGNVAVTAGGDAGQMQSDRQYPVNGLDVVVASTGSVSGNAIVQSGGGDATITIGGAINPNPRSGPGANNGTLVDLRGDLSVEAGSIGTITLRYDSSNASDPRPASAYTPKNAMSLGGIVVVPGDAQATLTTRGTLVLGGPGDAIITSGAGQSTSVWFSLWRPNTSLNLVSYGGNLTPTTQAQSDLGSPSVNDVRFSGSYNFIAPPTFTTVAISGSIYYAGYNPSGGNGAGFELAPSANGQLALVAGGSIDGLSVTSLGKLPIDISGADPNNVPTPLNPAYSGSDGTNTLAQNAGGLFAFEADTPTTNAHAADPRPALIYAGSGDIVSFDTGQTITFPATSGVSPSTWYVAGKPVQIRAGRDIVDFGTEPAAGALTIAGLGSLSGTYTSSVVYNDKPSDISTLVAGRDVIYANQSVAGPGLLFVQAGRNVYQGDQGVLESVGPQVGVTPATQDSGAGITVLAGVGTAGPNWTGFANAYLNPANLANPAMPLQDQPGKVVRDYDQQLAAFLADRFGFSGTAAQARALFATLPRYQQDVFLLQIYFAELNIGGLDYNRPASRFHGSYLEGTRAIDLLFPGTTNGQSNPAFTGALTMFSGVGTGAAAGMTIDSGIRTDFGGNITAVVPGGGITVGVQGVIPGTGLNPKPGIITQGTGDIDLYASGSVELGLSRIFTTFGGGLVIWSENGDIAGGNGAKSTVVFAPALIGYDVFGDVTLSPTVPTTGAGIATLAPIPQVPPGDINLVSPNGIIDAGEAGIRASGNANFAARVIVNAANIQVQGKTSGIPLVAVPNVSAQSAAAAAAGAAANAAQQAVARSQAPAQTPSDIEVEVLGF